MDFDQPPVVRVQVDPRAAARRARRWPDDHPGGRPARRARDSTLATGVTFLVGENGSGKSTIVEAIAMAYGLSPEGGVHRQPSRTRPTESPLGDALHAAARARRGSRWGFFLRAETMHGCYTYLEENRQRARRRPGFHELSHGESFLAVLATPLRLARLLLPRRARGGAVVLLDPGADRDPAAARGRRRGQVLCATHSPVLAALPGATILEVGDVGAARDDVGGPRAGPALAPVPRRPGGPTCGTCATDLPG